MTPTPSPTGADVSPEQARKIAERYTTPVGDAVRFLAAQVEALTKERDSFRRDFLAVRDQRAADVCRFDDARNERASLEGQVQYLKDQVAAQVDIAKAAVWDIDEVKAERDALRAKLAEAESEITRRGTLFDDRDEECICQTQLAEQAEARAVALAKERDEAITSLRLTQKARADDIGRLQQKCSDWGTYWRASDAHGVKLSVEQSVELLQDALGVEVEILAATPPTEAAQPPAEPGNGGSP